ncbi:unnamed protein product, partial [Polarella glacialis]
VNPALRAYDVGGVMLAFISDEVPEAHERAAAVGLYVTWVIAVCVLTLPLAGFLPAWVDVVISMASVAVRLVLVFSDSFPETLRNQKPMALGLRK